MIHTFAYKRRVRMHATPPAINRFNPFDRQRNQDGSNFYADISINSSPKRIRAFLIDGWFYAIFQ